MQQIQADPWTKRMIELRRKTLVVCAKCHDLIHAGKLDKKKILPQANETSGEPSAMKVACSVRWEAQEKVYG